MTKEVVSYEKVCINRCYDLSERVASYGLQQLKKPVKKAPGLSPMVIERLTPSGLLA